LEDSGRAEIPLTSADNRERYPAGLALNLTAERETPLGGESFGPPSPLLHVLASDGLLCSFYCVNSAPDDAAQQLCAPAPGLPTDNRRTGSISFPQAAAAAAKPAQPAAVKEVAVVPPPPATQEEPAKPAVTPFGSGIFNLNSSSASSSFSFAQSTPVQNKPAVPPAVGTTAAMAFPSNAGGGSSSNRPPSNMIPAPSPSELPKPPAQPAGQGASKLGGTASETTSSTRQRLCEAINEAYHSFESELANLRTSVRDTEHLAQAVGQSEDKVRFYQKKTAKHIHCLFRNIVECGGTAHLNLDVTLTASKICHSTRSKSIEKHGTPTVARKTMPRTTMPRTDHALNDNCLE
jgi:hypothetical protein